MNKYNGGYTLVEVLCAVIVVILISGMIVTGITFGAQNYGKNLTISEARTLYCTLSSIVADELRFAGTVETDASGFVTDFFTQSYGSTDGSVFETDENGRIVLAGHRILSNSAYTRGAKAAVVVKYDSDTGIFNADITISGKSGTEIYRKDFDIKRLNS